MKPFIRKVTTLAAAMVVMLPSIWFACAPLRQWMAREVMEERILAGLSDDELDHFVFSSEERSGIEWEREGREFRCHGRMYDVVRSHCDAKGALHLWCVDDARETRLLVEAGWLAEHDGDRTRGKRLDRITLLRLAVAPLPPVARLRPSTSIACAIGERVPAAVRDGVLRLDPPPPRH